MRRPPEAPRAAIDCPSRLINAGPIFARARPPGVMLLAAPGAALNHAIAESKSIPVRGQTIPLPKPFAAVWVIETVRPVASAAEIWVVPLVGVLAVVGFQCGCRLVSAEKSHGLCTACEE